MTFYFDMDGTIADLYSIEGWRDDLQAENARPYAEARPLVDCERLHIAIMLLKAEGYKFGIISWTSRDASAAFRKEIRRTKIEWIDKYFPDCFDEIHIVKYGTPKHWVAKDKNGILFDDEVNNRDRWNKGLSFTEKDIFSQLEW